MDPIQFVRDQLGGPTIDAEDYRDVKQNVNQLNEEVRQIKAELARISSALFNTTDSRDASTGTVVCDHHNDSSQSMENNVGDSNHASLLNDSDVFDDTANQTVINVEATDLSTEEQHDEIAGVEYTVEYVEVEVECQANDSMQSDASFSNSMIYTLQPKTATPNGNGSITFGDFDEAQSDELCSGGGADQSSSPESISVANGVSHAVNVELVIEDVQTNDTDSKSTECEMASTPKKPSDDPNTDGVDSKMDININDLPIDMPSDDLEDQP